MGWNRKKGEKKKLGRIEEKADQIDQWKWTDPNRPVKIERSRKKNG